MILERLLDIPSDLMEEVVVVACDGCKRAEGATSELEIDTPVAVWLSLQSILNDVGLSRERLKAAHAVLTLAWCNEDCVSRLLTEHREPDVALVAPKGGDEVVKEHIRSEIEALCNAPRQRFVGEVFELDAMGRQAPFAITHLSRKMQTLAVGEGVCVRCDDTSFGQELELWSRQTGYTLERAEIGSEGETSALLRWLPTGPKLSAGFGVVHQFEEEVESLARLDCLGLSCPVPVVRISQKAREMRSGRIEVFADDPAFRSDVQAWCDQSGAELMSLDEDPESNGVKAIIKLAGSVPRRIGAVRKANLNPQAGEDLPLFAKLDQRALRSPMHIVELNKEANRHKRPGLIEITVRDDSVETDIRNWAKRTGATVLEFKARGDELVALVAINTTSKGERKESTTLTMFEPTQDSSDQAASDASITTLDYTGLRCPLPILRLNEQLRMNDFKEVQLISDDLAFPSDLRAWCDQNGATLATLATEGTRTVARIMLPNDDGDDEELESEPLSYTAPESTSRAMPLRRPSRVKLVASTSKTMTPTPIMRSAKEFLALEAAARELDYRGFKCPMPILKLSAQLGKDGSRPIRILTDDPAFPADIQAWCTGTKIEILSLETEGTVHTALILPKEASRKDRSRRDEKPTLKMRPLDPNESGVRTKEDLKVDCRGLTSPQPILKLGRESAFAGNQAFEAIGDDPNFADDVTSWCQVRGFEILSEKARGDDYHLVLKRKKKKDKKH